MLVALLVCSPLLVQAKAGLDSIAAGAIAAHVRFLADDLLEGRGTGERGHAIAERYLISQMQILGLRPGGEAGTFLQEVLLRDIEIDPERTRLELSGKAALRVFEDFIPIVPSAVDADVQGPLVLVGYGVQAAEAGYDDFRDVDLKGRVAVWLSGAPALPALSSTARSVLGDVRVKWKAAASRGAVGFVTLLTPERLRLGSFEASARAARRREVAAADPQPLGPGVTLRPEIADGLLSVSGRTVAKLVDAAVAGHPVRGELGERARLRIGAKAKDLRSHNVAGMLPATDGDSPEVLVVSAHLDHLGIGDPVNGDAIYNGAVDNATGIGEMLEIARAMAAQPSRKRGVLFLAVTGEELGLLGSAWFVKHPTVPLADVVADLNLDQLSPMWKPHDVVLRGAEQSTLEDHVRAAAGALGLSISPDPVPEQNFFSRSDQYNFARAGVPAACLWQGFKDDKGGDSNGDIFRRWRGTRYHQPDDDLSQPFDWAAAAQWTRFEFLVAYSVMQGARPKWKKDAAFAGSARERQ
jgi:Zn-dependent M28 family amino/carboxypeptidase